MSNPLPIIQPTPRRGSPPESIEPALYPGLADLRPHCAREGTALIDRAYRDAAALHKRVRDLEAELSLYVEPPRRDAAETSAMGISSQEAEELL